MAAEYVVLVDHDGRPTGTAEKLDAHRAPGLPHLAFSLVLFRADGAVLLQRRSLDKHHFAGLWSNSCCSHPRPGEPVLRAAARRAREELGVRIDGTEQVSSFWYRAADPVSGLVEHELDVVLTARTDDPLAPDVTEVASTLWLTLDAARAKCRDEPGSVTPWLGSVLAAV